MKSIEHIDHAKSVIQVFDGHKETTRTLFSGLLQGVMYQASTLDESRRLTCSQKTKKKHLNDQYIASVITQMHAYDLVHRDIKVKTILIDGEHEQVYLADFGTF
ncbi:hypothetical protein I4U23_015603 [Adineta vaga]|nr:hypothetical protein I4U23_015603 [Adineta vaga]